jgi:hypothetical protein
LKPYENVNLKLFAAMAELSQAELAQAPMIHLVEHYARLFPDEAKRIYTIFIFSTWGATISQPLALEMEEAAAAGARGDIAGFQKGHAFPVSDVVAGKIALDANLGPELWMANSDFKIARNMWTKERTLPLTINLNTATEAELMTAPGVDIATARKIVAARRARGYFQSVSDLSGVLPPDLVQRLVSMAKEMQGLGPYPRE